MRSGSRRDLIRLSVGDADVVAWTRPQITLPHLLPRQLLHDVQGQAIRVSFDRYLQITEELAEIAVVVEFLVEEGGHLADALCAADEVEEGRGGGGVGDVVVVLGGGEGGELADVLGVEEHLEEELFVVVAAVGILILLVLIGSSVFVIFFDLRF